MKNFHLSISAMALLLLVAACGSARFSGGSGGKKQNNNTNTPVVDPTLDPNGNPPGTTTQINDNEVEFGSDKVFHIGDNDFGASTCRKEIATFDLHGTKYFFEFEVTEPATNVDITIRRICGVDYSDSNFVRVLKNGGEVSGQPLLADSTQVPLNSLVLEPGKYAVMVESKRNFNRMSRGDNDDFLVGNIYVKASKKIVGGSVRAE